MALTKTIQPNFLPRSNLHILDFSMASPKLIYPRSAFAIPLQLILSICDSHNNQFSQYVTQFMQPFVNSKSASATILYNSLNQYILMIISSLTTFSLLFHSLCIPYPISVSYISPYRQDTDQANFNYLHLK